MNIKVQKILEYDDIFQDEPINIEETLRKYNREIIVRCVCVLGHSFGNAFVKRSIFFSEATGKRINQLNTKLTATLNRLGVEDICYLTTKTSLELLRVAFSIPPDLYDNTGREEDFEYDIFKVILKLNQSLFFYKPSDSIQLDELIYFNQFATNDTNNVQLHSVFRTQCYYTSELFVFLEHYHPDVLTNFLKLWEINDYKQYILTIYSIFSICNDQQLKTPQGYWLLNFKEIPIHKGLFCPQVAKNLSVDINEVIPYSDEETNKRTDNTDYRKFRSRPLIRIADDTYYVYNLQLLIERTYNSLFFDLKSVWNDQGFSDFFNKQFVEHYMFRQTIRLCSDRTDYLFPTSQMIDGHECSEFPNQPDFYIRRQKAITLFECKAFKMNGGLKDNADIQDFLRILKLKIYEATENIDKSRKTKKKPEPVGVTQLVTEIEKIEDREFPFDNMIPDKVKYYPVIVLEDSRFIQPGLMSIVNRWSKKLLHEKLGDAAYYPIILTSIDILFFYSDAFKKIGFPRIIDKFIQSNAKLNKNKIDWEINPMADFNSFVKGNYKRNKEDTKWFDGFLKRITSHIL